MTAAGSHAFVDTVDVTDQVQVSAATERLAARGPLGSVVWAAGALDWNLADQADPDVVRNLITVNLAAAAAFAPLILPHLIEAAPSSLILLGSAAGHQAFAHKAAYVASKQGLTGLARALFPRRPRPGRQGQPGLPWPGRQRRGPAVPGWAVPPGTAAHAR